MLKILKYMKKYWAIAISAPVLKLFECFLELMVPLTVARIIDVGIANSDLDYVTRSCLLLVALAIAGFSCTFAAQWFSAKAATSFTGDIKSELFHHIQQLSYSQLDELGSSTLITRLTSDMNQILSGTNLTLRLLLRSPFIVFSAMVMAFSIDADLALIFVALIPVLALIVYLIMSNTIPLYSKVQGSLDNVLNRTKENLTGVRVIRAFNMQKEEISRYREAGEALNAFQQKAGRISALMNPLTYLTVNLAVIILMWFGALKVNDGILSSGQIVALYNYMSQILIELIKLANLIISITKAFASGKRVQMILDIEPSITDKKQQTLPVIGDTAVEFKNVSLKYHVKGEESLKDISFKIPRGSTVGIIGPTGSGKTSLVNLMPRFYESSEGSILVDGNSVSSYPIEQLRRKFGIVAQKTVLFKGTVRSNLLWGNPDADEETLLRALKMSQSYEFVFEKDGLETIVEQGGLNFSGGQRQRLSIARALVRQPEFLILDDSSSALDFATDSELRKSLKKLGRATTTFIISQRTSSIKHADTILVMEDGSLVGQGTHDELLKNCNVYQEIHESQFKKEAAANA